MHLISSSMLLSLYPSAGLTKGLWFLFSCFFLLPLWPSKFYSNFPGQRRRRWKSTSGVAICCSQANIECPMRWQLSTSCSFLSWVLWVLWRVSYLLLAGSFISSDPSKHIQTYLLYCLLCPQYYFTFLTCQALEVQYVFRNHFGLCSRGIVWDWVILQNSEAQQHPARMWELSICVPQQLFCFLYYLAWGENWCSHFAPSDSWSWREIPHPSAKVTASSNTFLVLNNLIKMARGE